MLDVLYSLYIYVGNLDHTVISERSTTYISSKHQYKKIYNCSEEDVLNETHHHLLLIAENATTLTEFKRNSKYYSYLC